MYRTGQLKRKPYSQMWRCKEEAARFEKLQSQYLYLCKYNIRSAEELKEIFRKVAEQEEPKDFSIVNPFTVDGSIAGFDSKVSAMIDDYNRMIN